MKTETYKGLAIERDKWKSLYFTMLELSSNATEIAERREQENERLQTWINEIFRRLGLPPGDMGALENYILSNNIVSNPADDTTKSKEQK